MSLVPVEAKSSLVQLPPSAGHHAAAGRQLMNGAEISVVPTEPPKKSIQSTEFMTEGREARRCVESS